jgi:hypothetical protein
MDRFRKLLILDVSGVLCHKQIDDKGIDPIFLKNLSTGGSNNEKLEVLRVKGYNIILRPYLREFLEFCYASYDVAFLSSTTYSNCTAILDRILTVKQHKDTVFKWFRDHTHYDPSFGTDSKIKPYDTVKYLSDVWNNPVINADRLYSPDNTIICDDSEGKMRYNPKENTITVVPFDGNPNDTVLLELIKDIPSRFDVL